MLALLCAIRAHKLGTQALPLLLLQPLLLVFSLKTWHVSTLAAGADCALSPTDGSLAWRRLLSSSHCDTRK